MISGIIAGQNSVDRAFEIEITTNVANNMARNRNINRNINRNMNNHRSAFDSGHTAWSMMLKVAEARGETNQERG